MATQIKFDERNYRKHSKKNKAIIKKSLSELGAGRSILLDNEDSLIAGNGVYEQAQALGIPVRVIETDGSELIAVKRTDLATGDEKRRKLALADNVASDLSEFDVPLLQTDWSIEALGEWGVELPEIEEAEPKDAQEDNFNPDEEKIETVCKEGDLWQLGNHRLMCGDSTSREDVARLMDGKKADMCFTDPPYGMKYTRHIPKEEQRFDMLENDDTILDFFPCVEKFSDGFVFICTTFKVLDQWLPLFKRYLNLSNMIIWYKGGGGLGDLKTTFAVDYEVILVSSRKNEIYGKRIGSVWECGRDSGIDYKHPTQKPIELSATAINHTTKASDIVLDLFGGSGSTLIACEQLGRKCYMMELDEHYCDVIIARWEKFTGQKAIKL